MSEIPDFVRIITDQNPTTDELIQALATDEASPGRDYLFSLSRSFGVGLARDGKWYHYTQNEEVKEAIENGRPTFLADQWFRNRTL